MLAESEDLVDIAGSEGVDLASEIIHTPHRELRIFDGFAGFFGFDDVAIFHLVDASGLIEPATFLVLFFKGGARIIGVVVFEPGADWLCRGAPVVDAKKIFHEGAVVTGGKGFRKTLSLGFENFVAVGESFGKIVIPHGKEGVADGVRTLEKSSRRPLAGGGHIFDTFEALVGGSFDEDAVVAGKKKVVFTVENAFLAVGFVGVKADLVDGQVTFTGVRQGRMFEDFQRRFDADPFHETAGGKQPGFLIIAKNVLHFGDVLPVGDLSG